MRKLAARPYPWKCGNCRQRAVYPNEGPYATEIAHDGQLYHVKVPQLQAPGCTECGELVLTSEACEQISDALRELLGLLQPDEIRRRREALGLTQQELAAQLDIDAATLSRWETGGQIQQRAMDNLLRVFFTFGDVRSALSAKAAGREHVLS